MLRCNKYIHLVLVLIETVIITVVYKIHFNLIELNGNDAKKKERIRGPPVSTNMI